MTDNDRIAPRADRRDWGKYMQAIPRHLWPDGRSMRIPPVAAWRSRHFVAVLYDEGVGAQRLSVNRAALAGAGGGTFRGAITWDELQRVKSECGFADDWAVEVYPPDGEVVNVANMRHLWLLGTATPAFGWTAERTAAVLADTARRA